MGWSFRNELLNLEYFLKWHNFLKYYANIIHKSYNFLSIDTIFVSKNDALRPLNLASPLQPSCQPLNMQQFNQDYLAEEVDYSE